MTVTTFKLRQQYDVSKAMTVARIAMSNTLMPVTVDTFSHRSKSDDSYEEGSFQASKTTAVTRMATPRGPIPVIVGTFEASGGRGGGDTIGGGGWERGAQTHI